MPTYRVDIKTPKGSNTTFAKTGTVKEAEVVGILDTMTCKSDILIGQFSIDIQVREALYDEVSFTKTCTKDGHKCIFTIADFEVVRAKKVEIGKDD